MLKITIPASESWDPVRERFVNPTKETTIVLEHSLVSISKWEMKWKVPFLHTKEYTREMFEDYVRCMTLTQNVDPKVYHALTPDNLREIQEYMADPMTATTISKHSQKGSGRTQIMTSELIYAHMAILRIPFECQKWHLNRLLVLIECTNIEQQPDKKLSKSEAMSRMRSAKAAARAKRAHK